MMEPQVSTARAPSAQAEERMIALLVEAFFSDPFYVFIMPSASNRRRQLRWWMGALLRNGLRAGEVMVAGELEKPLGVAVWLGPERPRPNGFSLAMRGLIAAPWVLGPKGFSKMLAVTGEWQTSHRKEAAHHFYLNLLAVSPSQQGKGLGSALIRAGTERASSQGLNTYLETCTTKNVKTYERHGFSVLTEKTWGEGDASWTAYTMRRGQSPSPQ